MIAIFNFNTYLGGGETLMVRWASYLKDHDIDCRLFFKKGSYIERDLNNRGIDKGQMCPIESDTDYYYIKDKKRKQLLDEIHSYLKNISEVQLVSFCARELYTLTDYCKINRTATLTHMILHNQDNLYLCQSLWDKFVGKLGISRNFSRNKMIEFNARLFNLISNQSVVISQSELQAALLKGRFGIIIKPGHVVALPVCDFSKTEKIEAVNNHKILWIGRICDTKIPSLCAMMNVVNRLDGYTLTVVGDGDMDVIDSYIKDNNIDRSKLNFVGEVQYAQLENIIKGHSVGYAIGTSIMEIGKYGLPVIMALYAPDCKLFEIDVCGGLYNNVSLGNIGDNFFYPEFGDKEEHIEDVLNYIDNNYQRAADDCYDYIKENCDLNGNLSKYMELINQSKIVDTSDIIVPSASVVRKLMYQIFS